MNVLHGSANTIGGQNVVIKLRWGNDAGRAFVFPGAMPGIKFALGENVTRPRGGGAVPVGSHLAEYGHPSTNGFKDVIHQWKAAKFDPDKLLSFYKENGAKYFMALANHHDNFDNFNSQISAVELGRDRPAERPDRRLGKSRADSDLARRTGSGIARTSSTMVGQTTMSTDDVLATRFSSSPPPTFAISHQIFVSRRIRIFFFIRLCVLRRGYVFVEFRGNDALACEGVVNA